MRVFRFLRSAGSFKRYYRLLNELYRSVYGRELMLHFPFYADENESFEQRQINLVDHCVSLLPDLSGKNVLEVGCGNGANCTYISGLSKPAELIGIDLNEENLEIADRNRKDHPIRFLQDDAQELARIPDNSIDVLICIESALHYPDKNAFFSQIKRVLKPEGVFLIADIIRRSEDSGRSLWWWKKEMMLHHATEEEYLGFADRNELSYIRSEDITGNIVDGYRGYRSWISRHDRRLSSFVLLRITLALLVRLYLKELRKHKKYMVFKGEHA